MILARSSRWSEREPLECYAAWTGGAELMNSCISSVCFEVRVFA